MVMENRTHQAKSVFEAISAHAVQPHETRRISHLSYYTCKCVTPSFPVKRFTDASGRE